MSTAWIDQFLLPDRRLRDIGRGLLSAVDSSTESDSSPLYDRHAGIYDLVVGNPLYNRLIWRTSTASYRQFAAAAVDEARGPLLDVGCGTGVFTAGSYRSTDRQLVLVDYSVGMLVRATKRLKNIDADRIAFVQADLFDLQFQRHRFETVTCYGLLHLFDDPARAVASLRSQVTQGGSLHATSLVAETRAGTRMLQLLNRNGEAAQPRGMAELSAIIRDTLDDDVEMWREGSTAFIRWHRSD